jgi:hypothetical protein
MRRIVLSQHRTARNPYRHRPLDADLTDTILLCRLWIRPCCGLPPLALSGVRP